MTTEAVCSVDECGKPARAAGLCPTHYQRQRRGKALEAPLRGEVAPLAPVSFRASAAVLEALEAEASARQLEKSDVIREVLEGWAARRAKKTAKAPAAKARK
jgi:hypothetical protein